MDQAAAIREIQERIACYEDMKAYNRLFELLSAGLFRFTLSLVRSQEAAEEIVSDVFIKLWQTRNKLREINNLKVYLYTIARNLSLNHIARHARNTVLRLDDIDVEEVIELRSPADICISADLIRHIRRIIRQLPSQCRLIFQLVKEEGLKYKEVAAILEISPLTVRNQLAIAVRRIGEALPSHLGKELAELDRFSHS